MKVTVGELREYCDKIIKEYGPDCEVLLMNKTGSYITNIGHRKHDGVMILSARQSRKTECVQYGDGCVAVKEFNGDLYIN